MVVIVKFTIYTIKLQSCHYLHAKYSYLLLWMQMPILTVRDNWVDDGLSSYDLAGNCDETMCNFIASDPKIHSTSSSNPILSQYIEPIFKTNSSAFVIGFTENIHKNTHKTHSMHTCIENCFTNKRQIFKICHNKYNSQRRIKLFTQYSKFGQTQFNSTKPNIYFEYIYYLDRVSSIYTINMFRSSSHSIWNFADKIHKPTTRYPYQPN